VGSKASFGFLSKEEWESKFEALGFALKHSSRLGRLDRSWRQPYARTAFVLGVEAGAESRAAVERTSRPRPSPGEAVMWEA